MNNKFEFRSLSPQSLEDKKHQRYFEKLDFALGFNDNESKESHRIRNIAITGGYGAGKSTLINSYIAYREKRDSNFEKKTLLVSLATFNLHADSSHDKSKGVKLHDRKDVELSILQQLIYHERASVLPHSRFKRIQNMTDSELFGFFVQFVFCILLSVLGYISFALFSDLEPYNKLVGIGLLTIVASIILFPVLKRFYTGNYSLDKVNLTKAEISLTDNLEQRKDESESLLNIYLDEIVYFFDETDYRYVIFEDLDRTEHVEIFVKLREINQIVNSARPKDSPIKFIYAVRDGLFNTPEDRTKFFEYIIPIIPVLDFSNSYELLESELQRYPKLFEEKEIMDDGERKKRKVPIFAESFLQDISLFINDMRVMTNIVNEFYVYFEKELFEEISDEALESKIIDRNSAEKVLALMVYKNLMPLDFSKIKERTSILYRIVEDYNSGRIFKTYIEPDYKKKKEALIQSQQSILKEPQNDIDTLIEELVKKYIIGGDGAHENMYYGKLENSYYGNQNFNDKNKLGNNIKNIFTLVVNATQDIEIPFYKRRPGTSNYGDEINFILKEDIITKFKEEHVSRLVVIADKKNNRLSEIDKKIKQIDIRLNPENYSLSSMLEHSNNMWKKEYLSVELQDIDKLKNILDNFEEFKDNSPFLEEMDIVLLKNLLTIQEKEVQLKKNENSDILVFLLLNGYIDESYPLYISDLHNNSPNVIEYRKSLSNRESYDKSHRIVLRTDDIPDLIARLNIDNVYKLETILNLDLMKHLILNSDEGKNKDLLQKIIEHHFRTENNFHTQFIYDFVKKHSSFSKVVSKLIGFIFISEEQLDSYYNSLDDLVDSTSEHNTLIKHIFVHVPKAKLENSSRFSDLVKDLKSLSDFVNQFDYFTEREVKSTFSASFDSSFKLEQLTAPISENAKSIFEKIVEKHLYFLTLENIEVIATSFDPSFDIDLLSRSHLSTIIKLGNSALENYIFGDINFYVKNIYLKLESNTADDAGLIVGKLLNKDELDIEYKVEILKQMTVRIDDITLLKNIVLEDESIKIDEENESEEEEVGHD